MTQLFNKKSELEKRRILRKNTTEAEKRVWIYLRKRQTCNERFLRQFSINQFVLDFYCPRLRIAIEIDGDIHFADDDIIQYDKERQKFIETLGIQFLRFNNDDVFSDLDGVMKSIEIKVKELQNPNPS
jgi:very-short-patch-repair endonuclease